MYNNVFNRKYFCEKYSNFIEFDRYQENVRKLFDIVQSQEK